MAAKKEKTEVRRHEIARAALKIIASHGMKGLNMAAIAREVGIVPSAIYRHFPGKEAVIDAIMDFVQHRLRANARAAMRVEGGALARLHSLLTRHVKLFRENEAIPVVAFSSAIYAGNPRRLKLQGVIDSYLGDVAVLVGRGQQEGSVRADLDPAAVAVAFIGMVLPPALLWHVSAGSFDVATQAEAAWPMFRRAIESGGRLE